MSMFMEILKSINNPNQPASVDQLGSVLNTVQQLGGNSGLKPEMLQTVISGLGGAVLPALKQQQAAGGDGLTAMLGQLAGNSGMLGNLGGMLGGNAGGASSALSALLPPQVQQQVIQGLAQKTGLNASMLESLVPTLLPAVMGFLNLGAGKPGSNQPNPVLTAFLDANGDGATDLGDVLKFASRFLK
jgi:hypothetical protein